MEIFEAKKSYARDIARLIMIAMNYDCCQNFIGPNYLLQDFEDAMTCLVLKEDSQYSYLNTLVCLDSMKELLGICVSYDGAKLRALRKAFQTIMMERFNRDFSLVDDETSSGELYIDSLAVREDVRRKGIATALILKVIEKAKRLNIPKVGLLVDKGNHIGQKLYQKIGFEKVDDAFWGGHPMMHLQYKIL